MVAFCGGKLHPTIFMVHLQELAFAVYLCWRWLLTLYGKFISFFSLWKLRSIGYMTHAYDRCNLTTTVSSYRCFCYSHYPNCGCAHYHYCHHRCSHQRNLHQTYHGRPHNPYCYHYRYGNPMFKPVVQRSQKFNAWKSYYLLKEISHSICTKHDL